VTSDGDEARFEAFYEEKQENLLGYLHRMGLRAQDAEEVFNDSFLALWKHWAGIDEGNRSAYLYQVARYRMFKLWKPGQAMIEQLVAEPPPSSAGDFAQQVVDRQAILWAVTELTEREREALLLRYYVGFSVSETAMIMDGISQNTVKRYAFDAREKLRRALGNQGDSQDTRGES
jgi:RNA polymerase sigma-70 factor (ECF subfamily)